MMSEESNQHVQLGDVTDSSLTEYQAVSGLAVAGLLVGVSGLAAFLGPGLYVIPVVGIVLNVAALIRIGRKSSAVMGRKAAVVGLIVSLACLSIAPSHFLTGRWLLRKEARQFAPVWFDFLARGEPHKAHQLASQSTDRPPLDERLWDVYVQKPDTIQDLEGFLDKAEVRVLLALGQNAQVRYYSTQSQWRKHGNDCARLVYAVTYDADGTKTSFFVSLDMERLLAPGTNRPHWHVFEVAGGIRPKPWEKRG